MTRGPRLKCSLLFLIHTSLAALAGDPAADGWLPEGGVYPDPAPPALASFESLQAEFLAGQLKIRWAAPAGGSFHGVVLYTSADKPGHWAARDWRRYPMTRREAYWEAAIPVDHVDIPIVYFLSLEGAGTHGTISPPERSCSPMRICWPHRLGVEDPTRVFWPFLDGFEEGDMDGWRVLSDARGQSLLALGPDAKNGRAALRVAIPEGKRAVTVATTRVRGWQVIQQKAAGLSLWMRVEAGAGRARFSLLSHAFSTNQVIAPCRWEASLDPSWQQINVAFEDFRGLTLGEMDLFTLELIGEGPQQFLIDDLQLLGPWPLY